MNSSGGCTTPWAHTHSQGLLQEREGGKVFQRGASGSDSRPAAPLLGCQEMHVHHMLSPHSIPADLLAHDALRRRKQLKPQKTGSPSSETIQNRKAGWNYGLEKERRR